MKIEFLLCALGPLLVLTGSGADLYWRTDGVSAAINTANWANSSAGPFDLSWSAGSNLYFTGNSNLLYVTSTDVGNVTVGDNVTVTVTEDGTLTTGGSVRTFDIGMDGVLDWRSQNLSSASGTGFIKSGDGRWIMGSNGSSSGYTGGFTLNAGTVQVTGSKVFGSGVMTINGGTIESSGTLDFTPSSLLIGGDFGLTKTGTSTTTATWSMPVDLMGGTRTITQDALGVDRIFSGVISNGGLTKAGAGTLTLSNANNTYTGVTTVAEGTLKLGNASALATSQEIIVADGAILDAGTFTLGSGQTLSGQGEIMGSVTVAGRHAPDGNQTVNGSLSYGSGSIFEWDLSSASTESGFDTVNVNGAFGNASGDFRVVTDLNFNEGFWAGVRTWDSIFTASSASGWYLNPVVEVYSTAGSSRDVSSIGSFGISGTTLTWVPSSPIPEPSNAVVGVLIGAGLLRRKRGVVKAVA